MVATRRAPLTPNRLYVKHRYKIWRSKFLRSRLCPIFCCWRYQYQICMVHFYFILDIFQIVSTFLANKSVRTVSQWTIVNYRLYVSPMTSFQRFLIGGAVVDPIDIRKSASRKAHVTGIATGIEDATFQVSRLPFRTSFSYSGELKQKTMYRGHA